MAKMSISTFPGTIFIFTLSLHRVFLSLYILNFDSHNHAHYANFNTFSFSSQTVPETQSNTQARGTPNPAW